jgi:hypothetical protein
LPPAILRVPPKRQAADYIGVPSKKFAGVCSVAPIAMPDDVELYGVRDLDHWVVQLKSGAVDTDDEILSRLGSKAS